MATTTITDPRKVEQLRQFLTWMLMATTITVGFQFVVGLFFASGLTSILLVASLSQGVTLLWARRLAGRNRPSVAVAVVVAGLWGICLLTAYLCPVLFPMVVALIILSLVIGLPYLKQWQLSRLMIGAIVVTLLTSFLSLQEHNWQIPLSELFVAVSKLLLVPITIGLIVFLIWQYNQRLNQLLRQIEKDNAALQVSQQLLEAKVKETNHAAQIAQAQAQQLESTIVQLQNAQAHLIQSEKMSSLGQLVAGIAHEINNPVNFIYGNLKHTQDYTRDLLQLIDFYQGFLPNNHPEIDYQHQIIELEFLVADLPKMLVSMQVGAERIREIVLSLRNFSRLDEAEMKAVDIHTGIESTLMILQHRLKGKPDMPDISVIKEYETLPLVECFPGQLNQVLMNLIVNSLDALEAVTSPKEPPFIWIRTHLEEDVLAETGAIMGSETNLETQTITGVGVKAGATKISTKKILISVADNGVGIPDNIQGKIFDPFFTTKPVGKGTGLGLAIAHSTIVEKHGGKISCTSIPGHGTEFILEIPIQH